MLCPDDADLWQRHDELPAATEELLLPLEKLVEEVPRQGEVVVRVHRSRVFLTDDRDFCTDRLRSVLVRITVCGRLDVAVVDTGILKNRVALGRSAIDVDLLSFVVKSLAHRQ